MIGKLTGIVDVIGEDWVILDVNGVGYEVACSVRVLRALSEGESVSLAIDTYVREDVIRLFGFASEHERQWFRLLQTVQGVGAKVALAMLGTLSTQDIANAIALGDKAMIATTPGVGPKVAGRLVAELKDKAPKLTAARVAMPASGAAGGAVGGAAGGAGGAAKKGRGAAEGKGTRRASGKKLSREAAAAEAAQAAMAEAISALQNLGYQPAEASSAVATAMKELGEGADTAALIRRGLKALAAG